MSDRSGEVRVRRVDTDLHDLYRLYSGWLTARLRRRFGDDTDDLAQEAWMRATPYSRRGVIRHPKALLLRIVENLAIDQTRRDGPRSLSVVDRVDEAAAVDHADQIDLVFLKQIILGMPQPLRDVFVLSRIAHLEYQEIAERLDIPLTTVQWRMRKAFEYCAAQLRL